MDKPTPNSLYAWRDAQRHRLAITMLARQQALKEAGPTMAEEYLKKHRKRLTTEGRVDRQITRVGEVALPTALAQTVCEVLAGLINPSADQRKINVRLSCLGERHDDDDRDCVLYRASAVAGLLY